MQTIVVGGEKGDLGLKRRLGGEDFVGSGYDMSVSLLGLLVGGMRIS